MKNLKPDEVRKVGTEAIGALSLRRPEGNFSGPSLFLAVISFCIYLSGWLNDVLSQYLYWSTERVVDLATLLIFLSWFGGVRLIQLVRRRSQSLQLEIVQEDQISHPGDDRFEIWSGTTVFRRAMTPALSGLLSICMIWLFFEGNSYTQRGVGWLGAVTMLSIFINSVRCVFRPLLIADAQGIVLDGRLMEWKYLGSVKVEHLIDADGQFLSVKLTVKNTCGINVGEVSLLGKVISATKEKELLEFIARAFGHRVSTFTLTPSK